MIPSTRRLEVPVLLELGRAVLGHELLGGAGEQVLGVLLEVVAVDDLQAPLVDDLALLVHDLVVLEGVLAHLRVAGLDGVLRPLDRLRDRLGLDRHVLGQRAAHDPRHGAGGEEAQQLVVEATGRSGDSPGSPWRPERPRSWLSMRRRLVAFGAEHVEAAELADLLALGPASRLDRFLAVVEQRETLVARRRSTPSAASSCCASSSALPPRMMSTPRPAMFVATVTAPRRPAWATISASRKCCLAFRTLCVMPRLSNRRESSSDLATDAVPMSIGWPVSLRSTMSSTTALNLASSVLKTRSALSPRTISLLVGIGTTGSP